MNGKSMGSMLKGVGVGMAVGCIAGAVGYGYLNQNHKKAGKNVGKALHNVSRFVDNVGSML